MRIPRLGGFVKHEMAKLFKHSVETLFFGDDE
jgi:hypothetical protein